MLRLEIWLRRGTRLLPAATVIVCVLLAANAVGDVLGARRLLPAGRDDAMAAVLDELAARRAEADAVAAAARAAADGAGEVVDAATAVQQRNLFCADCVAEPADGDGDAGGVDDASVEVAAPPPLTTLPLTLVATQVHQARGSGGEAWATIAAAGNGWSGAFRVDDELPGVGPVLAISPRYVDFLHRAASRTERLDLLGAPPPPPPPGGGGVARAGAGAGGGAAAKGDALSAELAASIKRVDDTHYEVARTLVDKVLADPNLLAGSVRGRPVSGGPGFKLSMVRRGSAAEMLGLKTGDTVLAVNGYELGQNYDKLFELYAKLKSAQRVSIQVARGGKTLTLDYVVR